MTGSASSGSSTTNISSNNPGSSTTKNLGGSSAGRSGGGNTNPAGRARNDAPSGEPTRYTGPAGGGRGRSGGSNRSSGGGARSNTGYDNYGRGGGRGNYGGKYGDYGPPPPRNYRNVRPRNVQPQRDPFPYILGGVIGALVVGLMLVVFLLLNNRNGAVPGNPPQVDNTVAAGAATAAGDTPPRMPMDQFKTLYDDPAKRPIILDVRAKETFDAGHITGAESFPEADVDTRVSELPKDKLIVAYCQ
jgi:hypothetical protein